MKRQRVLVIVDEMGVMGKNMRILEHCMGMGAGAAGILVWCVLQDLSQLIGMFPETWQTFIQNCGVTMWWARDQATREYVSKLAGTKEVITRTRTVGVDRTGEPHVSDGASQQSRPLIMPHEVGQISVDEMICFVDGRLTIRAKRKPYWKLSRFRGKFSRNPYVDKPSLLSRLFG